MRKLWSVAALGSAALIPSLGCNDVLVEDVPPDVCVSGKRWVGGDRGSPNMYPGRDCVGCHKDHDAPELVLGGTFYDTLTAQSEDCFGVEGVRVTIIAGDDQRYETYTNESGNFWFAARDTDIALPIIGVEVLARNRFTGADERPGMITAPTYGGCARCHGAEQPMDQGDLTIEDPEFVHAVQQIGIVAQSLPNFLQNLADGIEPMSARFTDEELEEREGTGAP